MQPQKDAPMLALRLKRWLSHSEAARLTGLDHVYGNSTGSFRTGSSGPVLLAVATKEKKNLEVKLQNVILKAQTKVSTLVFKL